RASRANIPGGERLPRKDLLSLYERLVLFSNLDVPGLQEEMNRVVVDQREAVAALGDELSLYATGTQALSRPASFFLVGPTGVGKNYLVESFVVSLERMWGIEVPMLLIEGPQYTYPSDINELKGATRGFIRSDEEGILTEFYKRASESPLSVILVDEVEKAHPQLRKFFLGLMDRGTTMDNRGATLHFVNTIFFYTSNIGYSRLQTSTAPIGFADAESREDFKYREVEADLKKVLSPEFVNRTSVIRFRPLSLTSVERIFDLEFAKVSARYREVQGINLQVTPRGRQELIRKGYSPEFGARPLGRVINQVCNVEISKRLKRDERRSPRETGDLLLYLREVRDGKRALDPSAVDQILAQARAQVPYDTLEVDFDHGEFVYEPQEPVQ
ncbi:MAG TPA: AAA family ATPase, partial [Candidatus Saccharimonadales bacterium]|nr:AAA family ATPase [Candidatus Saccharimonadales bacterium]